MVLLTGPAGSGKTAFVLERLREALRARNHNVRLLVPTATLVQHLQNRIAREGFAIRRGLIQTLSEFVEPWTGDLPQVPDAVLYLLVEKAVRRINRPEFAAVAAMPGFCATLARTVAEFSSAGCDSSRLRAHYDDRESPANPQPPAPSPQPPLSGRDSTRLRAHYEDRESPTNPQPPAPSPQPPLGAPFLAVYQEVDRELDRRGFATRATGLARAAARIRRDGLGGIGAIWMDGFHALPDPELRVIEAMGRHADLTLTFDNIEPRLAALGFREERLKRSRATPVMAVVRAPGIEREVEEIARRILDQASAGRPFREMGIIVRAKETYVPILESTLERFGIPARFYFESQLEQHAAIRFLSGAVDAMLGGWDHARTLAVLRLAPRFADSAVMDRFAFAVREQVPNTGLGGMKALAGEGAERLLHLIDALARIEEWRSFVLRPRDWAARLRTLRNLFRPHIEPGALSAVWRSQAAALDLFDESLDEAAAALERDQLIGLEEFWAAVKSVFRLKPLRLKDERRNVVHVLSAPEARQWVLPVIFVCGMVEKQFPQFHRQDPFFPDAARCRLNATGVRVRTAAEFEREERGLFDSAITRATLLVTLSYPEFDARGERNLPSLFLEGLDPATPANRLVRPCPRSTPAPSQPAEIRAPALLRFLRQKTARLSPTQLEMYLQCPFQYFGGRVLRLKAAPPRPEKRLDFLTQGSVVHEVLAAWWAKRQELEPLFEAVFARHCEEKRIPRGYHAERLRNAMLDDLRAFAMDARWPRDGFRSRMEEKFVFALSPDLEISGRIDRLDVAPDGRAFVIDYKYSGAQRTTERHTNDNLLQAPLYMIGAEKVLGVRPAGMFYVGLKGGVLYAGWSDSQVGDLPHAELPENWRERAKERTVQAVEEIRSGRVEPAPADTDNCRFCDYRDVCRVQIAQVEDVVEGAP